MAINQLKAGAFLSYFSIGINNFIILLYTPFLLRKLGQSEFGIYSLVASVVAYLTILDFGFGNAVVRYTSKCRGSDNLEEQYSLYGMFFILYIGIGLLSIIAGLILYSNVNEIFGNKLNFEELSKARIMMLLLTFNLAITFPLSIFGSIIRAYEKFVFLKLVIIGRIILNPLIMIPILLIGYKAVAMVVIITLLNLISLLINFWFCLVKLKIKLHFNNFRWKIIKEILGYSFFVFLGIIVDKIYWNTGPFILGIYSGTTAVAIFAIAIRLQSLYISFSSSISNVFLPKVTIMVSQNASEVKISDLFIRTGRIQYIILALILSSFILFGKSFIRIWAGGDYNGSYLIAVIFMIALTIPLIQTLGITILQARNQHRFRSCLYAGFALLSLAISIPLTRIYGGVGFVIGTTFIMMIGNVLIINIYYYKKIHINIPAFFLEIGKLTLIILPVFIAGFIINQLYKYDTIVTLIVKILIFVILYILVMLFFGFNNFERNLYRKGLHKLIKIKNLRQNNS